VIRLEALHGFRVILLELLQLLCAPLLPAAHHFFVALGVGLFQVLEPPLELLPMLRHQLAEAFRIVLLQILQVFLASLHELLLHPLKRFRIGFF